MSNKNEIELVKTQNKSNGKGKNFYKPVVFQGGVAANIGMIRAFERVLDSRPDHSCEVIV